jgi:pyruvate dehydrogenase E1 component alpha subunit
VKDAADSARAGRGAYVVECITYRMGPHTTADDPKKYRNEEEVAQWRERDPIKRFRIYLQKKGIWNESYEAKVNEETTKIVEAAVVAAESFKPDPKNIFKFLFKDMPKDLGEQMKECFEEK